MLALLFSAGSTISPGVPDRYSDRNLKIAFSDKADPVLSFLSAVIKLFLSRDDLVLSMADQNITGSSSSKTEAGQEVGLILPRSKAPWLICP